jgi:hypothetical protein
MADGPSLQGFISTLLAFITATDVYNLITNATAAVTLTNLLGLYMKLTNGGAVVVTIDSAVNIVNSMPNAYAGQTWAFTIFSSGAGTVATPTLTDTTVTLVGTTSITAGNARTYQGSITQLTTTVGATVTPGTTFVSLAQIGTTNNYTLTLATNAVVPVVGTGIFLNVTAGTLPSGWYPVVKVTSATSFVISAPVAGVAWTATAVTIPGTAVVPASQYTPGFSGLFSPLITITAAESHAAIV